MRSVLEQTTLAYVASGAQPEHVCMLADSTTAARNRRAGTRSVNQPRPGPGSRRRDRDTKVWWRSTFAISPSRFSSRPWRAGPSTPELAAAGSTAGGLGFVPAGDPAAEVFAERLVAARGLSTGPVGANLFVPQPSAATPGAVEAYADRWRPRRNATASASGSPASTTTIWYAKIGGAAGPAAGGGILHLRPAERRRSADGSPKRASPPSAR